MKKYEKVVFEISEEEVKKMNKWIKKNPSPPRGTIGGSYTYSFTPTSIGVVVRVKNNASGKEEDITDSSLW